MKKNILKLFCLTVILVTAILVFLTGCIPQTENSRDEIKTELEELSDKELLEIATAEDNNALAGQGISIPKESSRSYQSTAKEILKQRLHTLESAGIIIQGGKPQQLFIGVDLETTGIIIQNGRILSYLKENGQLESFTQDINSLVEEYGIGLAERS